MYSNEMHSALEHLMAGKFQAGDEMELAHSICQRHEGEALFDWLHALVHRIEGDDANADYWYRRSGRSRYPGPVEYEWNAIRSEVEDI